RRRHRRDLRLPPQEGPDLGRSSRRRRHPRPPPSHHPHPLRRPLTWPVATPKDRSSVGRTDGPHLYSQLWNYTVVVIHTKTLTWGQSPAPGPPQHAPRKGPTRARWQTTRPTPAVERSPGPL